MNKFFRRCHCLTLAEGSVSICESRCYRLLTLPFSLLPRGNYPICMATFAVK